MGFIEPKLRGLRSDVIFEILNFLNKTSKNFICCSIIISINLLVDEQISNNRAKSSAYSTKTGAHGLNFTENSKVLSMN